MSGGPRLEPQLLVSAMSAFVGVLESARVIEPARWDGALAAMLGIPEGARWDAALVQHCGYWSQFDHERGESAWPIPEARTAEDLAAFGTERGLLRESPLVGDILLQFNPRVRGFVRAGVVAAVLGEGAWTPRRRYFDVISIEGGTDAAGRLGGGSVLRVGRRMSVADGDRVLRWSDVLAELASAASLAEAA